MTEAWVQSLFDEEPEVYGPKRGPSTGGGGGAQSKDNGTKVGADVRRFEKLIHNPLGAPPLDWWNVSEDEVHRRIILSMCPERVCRTCGEPSRRIVEVEFVPIGQANPDEGYVQAAAESAAVRPNHNYLPAQGMRLGRAERRSTTVGWTDCGHDDWRPGVVLDPFA